MRISAIVAKDKGLDGQIRLESRGCRLRLILGLKLSDLDPVSSPAGKIDRLNPSSRIDPLGAIEQHLCVSMFG